MSRTGQHPSGKQNKHQTYIAKQRHNQLLWGHYSFFIQD